MFVEVIYVKYKAGSLIHKFWRKRKGMKIFALDLYAGHLHFASFQNLWRMHYYLITQLLHQPLHIYKICKIYTLKHLKRSDMFRS